jgi:nucleotide-binding universal stress UspA family protein
MSTIVAAVDNSAAAHPVVAAAHLLAPIFGAGVECVHVAEVEGRTAASVAAALGVPFRTLPGDPLASLIELADDDDVVGFAIGQRSQVPAATTGHLALGLADSVDKPVLVVSPQAVVPDRFRRVLIAMAGVPGRGRDLKRAIALAARTELDLVAVHVDDEGSVPAFSDQVQYETEAYAEEFLARYAPGAPGVRLDLRIGAPVDEILAACAEEHSDVIAMGWPHADRPGRGDVVRAVLERSPVPVLLVATR